MNNSKLKLLYILTFAIFLTAVIFSLILLQPRSGQTVQILQNEKVLYTIDLSNAEDQTIKIKYEGGCNLIEIYEGKIRVKEADCPDNTCVKMGWLDSGAPVVCLPHHLVIRFAESGDVDAVAG